MVLAKKCMAWLQVMHERLKHLIISPEKFKEKKKAEYNARARAKQISKGKGIRKHSKGIRFLGVGRKEKGKWFCRNDNQMEVTPCNTSTSSTSGSTRGCYNKLFCLLDFCAVHVLISVFHFCFTVWVDCSLVVLV